MTIKSKVLHLQTGTGTTPVVVAHGMGEAPKFAIVLMSNATTLDAAPAQDGKLSVGFAQFSGTPSQAGAGVSLRDGVNTRRSAISTSKAGILVDGIWTFTLAVDATNLTLTPVAAFATNDTAVTVALLGGDGLTGVSVKSGSAPTATGAFSITGAGFTPTAALLIGSVPAVASSEVAQSNAQMSFGWATAAAQSVVALSATTVTPSDNRSVVATDACLGVLDTASDAWQSKVAFSAFTTDGVTLNRLTGTTAVMYVVALLQGPVVEAITTARLAAAGTITRSTGVGTPRLILGAVRQGVSAAQAVPTPNVDVSFGVSDLTAAGSVSALDPDNITSDTAGRSSSGFLGGVVRTGSNTFTAPIALAAPTFAGGTLSFAQTGNDASTALVPLLVIGETAPVVADRVAIASQPNGTYTVGDIITVGAKATNAAGATQTDLETGTVKLRARSAPAGWDLTTVLDSDTWVHGLAALTFQVPMAGTWTFGLDDDSNALTDSPASTATTASMPASGSTIIVGDTMDKGMVASGSVKQRTLRFRALSASGSAVTGLTGKAKVSINGAAAGDSVNDLVELGLGYYNLEIAAASLAAVDDTVQLYPWSTVAYFTGQTMAIVTAVDLSSAPDTKEAIAAAVLTAADTDPINATATLDATSIRSAIGLAAANLDTQLDALPTAVENAAALITAAQTTPLAADIQKVNAVTIVGDGSSVPFGV